MVAPMKGSAFNIYPTLLQQLFLAFRTSSIVGRNQGNHSNKDNKTHSDNLLQNNLKYFFSKINFLWRFPMGRFFRDFGLEIHSRYFLKYLAKHPEHIFRISLFFIGITFPTPRLSGITFDVSLADLKQICRPLEQHCFPIGTIFLKSTLDVQNLLKILLLENAIRLSDLLEIRGSACSKKADGKVVHFDLVFRCTFSSHFIYSSDFWASS